MSTTDSSFDAASTSAPDDALTLAGFIIRTPWQLLAADDPSATVELLLSTTVGAGFCDWIGVTQLGADGSISTVSSTDDRVRAADALQSAEAEGPTVHASAGTGILTSPNLRAETRWPRWAQAVADLGIAALLSVPLQGGRDGAANFYSAQPRTFGRADLELAGLIAAQLSILVGQLQGQHNTWRAMEARRRIGQAQGILMARGDVTASQAFAALRRIAAERSIDVAEVAADVIADSRLGDLSEY